MFFWNDAAPRPLGQAAAAGNGTVLAVGLQRHALGARPDVQLVGLARAIRHPLLQAVDLVHHTSDHIVGGPVGLAHRLGDVVYRYAIERPAKVHPDRQHPVPDAYVPIVQERPRLVVERLLAGLAGVPLEFPVPAKLDDGGMAFGQQMPSAHRALLNGSAAASASPNSTSRDSRGPGPLRPVFSRFLFVAPPCECRGSALIDLFQFI